MDIHCVASGTGSRGKSVYVRIVYLHVPLPRSRAVCSWMAVASHVHQSFTRTKEVGSSHYIIVSHPGHSYFFYVFNVQRSLMEAKKGTQIIYGSEYDVYMRLGCVQKLLVTCEYVPVSIGQLTDDG